jgi:glycosyltransferase involved in cell wall biosynthesis
VAGILVVHNRYVSTSPSGENAVVDEEMAQLRASGREVHSYIRSSDELQGVRSRMSLAVSPIYAHRASGELADLIDTRRPDVLHLHNPFPLISPWVVRVAQSRGVPVVQTVHNYRHVCVAGSLFRDGQVCEDCVGKRVGWPAVLHGCYRGSRLQSLPMVAAQAVHRPTWRGVDRFVVLTRFMAERLEVLGVAPEQLVVRPTATADPGAPGAGGSGFVYVGRLTEEKGVRLLIEAWQQAGLGRERQLTIVGDGPLSSFCHRAAETTPGLQVLGRLAGEEVGAVIAASRALVAPSLWFEGFPRVVVEAFSHGTPVVATRIGSLAEVVDEAVGWSVEPTASELAAALVSAAADNGPSRRVAARRRYVDTYRPEITLRQLLEVYDGVRLNQGA